MSREPIRITREELHRLVWSKTLRRITEDLGTSYVELVKACRVMDVPRPLPGHWEKLRLGEAVEQVPLSEAQAGAAVEFFLKRKGTVDEENLPPLPEAPPEEAEPAKAEPGAQIEEIADAVRDSGPVTVTRQELYEKVWQMSLTVLTKEWGTTYVLLIAACEAMNVPRPPNGHWSRVRLGLPVEKFQLPEAGSGTPMQVTLEPKLLRARQAAKSAEPQEVESTAAEQTANVRNVQKRMEPNRVELPSEGVELHPIAKRHVRALQDAKPGDLGFVSIRGPDLFWCDITLASVPRFERAVHALVCELERRGYSFQNGEHAEEGLRIVRGEDCVEVRWSEGKIELEREPTNVDKRRPSWTWNLKEIKATGQIAIELAASGVKGKRKWIEGDAHSLEGILGAVVEKIEATFRGFEEQRKRQAELARQQEEAEKLRLEEEAREAERQAKLEQERKERERVRRHEAKLEQIAELRRQNLLVAAKLWIQYRGVAAYVAYCETTWRVRAGGNLTQSQADWLAWAKGEAINLGPFGMGYPVPERDGKLDVSTVPVGGPYPEPTVLEELEEAESQEPAAEAEVKTVYVEKPQPFPYWALHRHR